MAYDNPLAGAPPGTSIAQLQPQRMAQLHALADRVATGGYALTAADKTLLNDVSYKVDGGVLKPKTFWDNYRTPIIAGAAIAGGFGALALAGGAAAAGGGATAAETGGMAGDLGTLGVPASLAAPTAGVAGVAAPAVVGGAAAAAPTTLASSSLLPAGSMTGAAVPGAGMTGTIAGTGGGVSSLFSGLTGKDYLNAGLGVAGSLIASHQVSKATDAQLQATREALAQSKAIYDQQRADQAPWRNAGAGAVNSLAYLMGVTPTKDTTLAPPATAASQLGPAMPANQAPQEVNKIAPQNLGSVGTQVLMRAPTGEVQAVPATMVHQLTLAGARQVS